MKIILDNIIYSKCENGGISNYWFELSKYLITETNHDLKFVQEKNDVYNFHRKQLLLSNDSLIKNEKSFSQLNRILPFKYQTEEHFIYHSSYYRNLIGAKNKVEITTVHDFIHNFYSPVFNRLIHNNLKYNAIKRSKGIICISKNTFSDLKKFCPPKKNQKVEVIYNGVSDDYFPISEMTAEQTLFLNKHKISDGYILYIGSRANYKNFDFAISVINHFKNLKLVVVGGGDINKREAKLFSRSASERTTFILSVKNEELNILYNNALALLYPSSYEGFGIPIIEAMRAGCPVIGLNNDINKEVTESSALLMDSLSLNDFDKQFQNLSNSAFLNEKVESGFIESKKYSWDKCCRETEAFYQSLY